MRPAALLLALLSSACASLPQIPPGSLPMLTDGVSLSVQIDPRRGGALSLLSILDGSAASGNLVNNSDLTGRQIQASYYDGTSLPLPGATFDPACWPALDAPPSCLWGYNPVQAGNAEEQPSYGVITNQTKTSLTVSTTPRQWDARQGVSHLLLEATTALFSPGVIRLDYRYTNHEGRALGADNVHELPCVYLDPRLTILTTGDGWLSVSDAAGWTVALVAPTAMMITSDFGKQPGKETTLLQAWQSLPLRPLQTATATAWIVVGHSLDQVRQRLGAIR